MEGFLDRSNGAPEGRCCQVACTPMMMSPTDVWALVADPVGA
jgi:hypothetical protein